MRHKYLLASIIVLSNILTAFAGWELVWSDEFDYTGLPDENKWGYDVGTGAGGWGNNELQYYTKDSLKNAHVENGTLIISARKEKIAQSNYTSARLVTLKKGDWLYGRFEIAAKLPKGRGLWPAIWMLPSKRFYGEWPRSGELDIMENVGFDSMKIHFNIHTEAYNHSIGTNKGATIVLDDPHTRFNVYALEWYEDSVVFFANDKKAFSFKNEHAGSAAWPFDQQFHLLLNIAIGGSWGGQQGVDDSVFPREMIIDYVRVYRFTSTKIEHHPIKSFLPFSKQIVTGNSKISVPIFDKIVIKFFSVDGKMLFTGAIQSNESYRQITCSLPCGMYIVTMNIKNEFYTQYFLNNK